MYNIAIIGDYDSIIPFKVLGVDTFPLNIEKSEEENKQNIKNIIEHLVAKKYVIIYITEEFASLSLDIIARYKAMITPIITFIPSNKGTLNIGMKNIDENIEKAIGTNIF